MYSILAANTIQQCVIMVAKILFSVQQTILSKHYLRLCMNNGYRVNERFEASKCLN